MEQKIECAHCLSKDKSPLCSIPHIVDEIEKVKVVNRLKAGETLFSAGEQPLGFFSVNSGLMKIESTSAQGNSLTLRVVGPGGAIGYRSLFADQPYKATAVAVEDSSLCFIPKNLLFEILRKHPAATLNLLCHISKDLGQAESKWVDQIEKAAAGRVAEALLFLSDQFTHDHWTRKEIAQWAGTTTETVIRTLAQFEKQGMIDQKDRQIRILNRLDLKETAEAE